MNERIKSLKITRLIKSVVLWLTHCGITPGVIHYLTLCHAHCTCSINVCELNEWMMAGENLLIRSRGSSFFVQSKQERRSFSDTEKNYAAIFVLQKTHLNDNECGKWISSWVDRFFLFVCLLFVFVFRLGKNVKEWWVLHGLGRFSPLLFSMILILVLI